MQTVSAAHTNQGFQPISTCFRNTRGHDQIHERGKVRSESINMLRSSLPRLAPDQTQFDYLGFNTACSPCSATRRHNFIQG